MSETRVPAAPRRASAEKPLSKHRREVAEPRSGSTVEELAASAAVPADPRVLPNDPPPAPPKPAPDKPLGDKPSK